MRSWFFIFCVLAIYCLHQATSSERNQQQQHQIAKDRSRQQHTLDNKRHQQQQHAHYSRKYQIQQNNYKKRIQHERRNKVVRQRYTYHRKQPVYHRKQPVYYRKQPVYHYKGKRYHLKKRKYNYIKWPRIRGRCKHSPWTIGGINPIMQEAAKGNMVMVYMLKPNDPFSYNQLIKMNDLAEHYMEIGRKVTMMALNHRSRSIPDVFITRFPLVKFYQEPASKNIYRQLLVRYRYAIIYDKCGRQQYHFAPPYSWLGIDLTRLAIDNVRRFHTDYNMCGVCKPPPKTTTKAPGNYTTLPPTSKPTQKSVDGPYTNVPVAVKLS